MATNRVPWCLKIRNKEINKCTGALKKKKAVEIIGNERFTTKPRTAGHARPSPNQRRVMHCVFLQKNKTPYSAQGSPKGTPILSASCDCTRLEFPRLIQTGAQDDREP